MKSKILIVDDNLTSQFCLVEALHTHVGKDNVDITITSNGHEACQIASQKEIDLVLMDIEMPVMDGITATEIISTQNQSNPPVLIVSATDDPVLIQRSRQVGAKGYLPKEEITENLVNAMEHIKSNQLFFPMAEKMPQNSENVAITRPNKVNKDLKITRIIAYKIIEEWFYGSQHQDLSRDFFLDYFVIKPNFPDDISSVILREKSCNLIEEFDLRFEYLISRDLGVKDTLAQVEIWFRTDSDNSFLNRMAKNSQNLRKEWSTDVQRFLRSFLVVSPPYRAIQYFEEINNFLKQLIGEYSRDLSKNLDKVDSIKRAYKVLSSSDEEDRDSLMRAIKQLAHSWIEIEVAKLAIDGLGSISRNIRYPNDDLNQTIELLDKVQKSLDLKQYNSSLASAIYEEFCLYQNPTEILQVIEKEFSYGLNYWGRQHHISALKIKEKLIAQITLSSHAILEDFNDQLN